MKPFFRSLRFSILLLAFVFPAILGCQRDAAHTERTSPVAVAVTFDILADLVRNVGGDLVEIHQLTPTGVSPRAFVPDEPGLRAVAEAELFVEAGLGFEPWAENLYRSSGTAARRLPLAHFVTLLPEPDALPAGRPDPHTPKHGHAHAHDPDTAPEHDHQAHSHEDLGGHRHGHGPGEHTHSQYDPAEIATGLDPRFWMDVRRVERVVNGIRNALVRLDPDNGETYHENAAAFVEKLLALDERIRTEIEQIPETDRVLVTDVDRFQYFAERYRFKVVALFPEGGAGDAAAEVVTERLRDTPATIVFTARGTPDESLARTVQAAGVKTARLYTETLDHDANSYLQAMRINLEVLISNLGDSTARN